jgi:hypothetical protein
VAEAALADLEQIVQINQTVALVSTMTLQERATTGVAVVALQLTALVRAAMEALGEEVVVQTVQPQAVPDTIMEAQVAVAVVANGQIHRAAMLVQTPVVAEEVAPTIMQIIKAEKAAVALLLLDILDHKKHQVGIL